MDSLPSRRIKDNEGGQIMGIPLYILLIVIIAAISLAAILGFMVTSEPKIDEIRIHSVQHGDSNSTYDSILVEERYDDGRAYYKGSERPDPDDESNTLRPERGYDQNLVVTAYDEEGNPMAGVDIEATGAGVSSVATTNASGMAELDLDGCRLLQNEDNAKIELTATYEGLIGENSVSNSIWVERP
ncbi:MAG: hypothetical protein V5A88_09240 [Candidatus Thermoplasmatota archaeon]